MQRKLCTLIVFSLKACVSLRRSNHESLYSQVCAVILRQQRASWQLLAFRHPLVGTPLIKGTLEAGKRPEVDVLRELAEESGILHAAVVEKIGELDLDEIEQHWRIYLCQTADELLEECAFFTTAGGGHLFHFFWHKLAEKPDESRHQHFQTALAFIKLWHEGR